MCPLQARMTGMGPSDQFKGRLLPPPEVPRRLTGSTHTDSTEADSPPLSCRPDYRLSTTAALALRSSTKVIVRFVFGLVVSYTGLYTREQIGDWKSDLVFWDLTANSLPHPYFVAPPNQPATNPSTKAAFRWVREETLASFFCSFSFDFLFILLCFFSLTPLTPLWLFCNVDR